jgi:hypothetical protein
MEAMAWMVALPISTQESMEKVQPHGLVAHRFDFSHSLALTPLRGPKIVVTVQIYPGLTIDSSTKARNRVPNWDVCATEAAALQENRHAAPLRIAAETSLPQV